MLITKGFNGRFGSYGPPKFYNDMGGKLDTDSKFITTPSIHIINYEIQICLIRDSFYKILINL